MNRELENRARHLNVLVTGRTGTGKSTLINTLLDDCVTETSDASVGTLTIQKLKSVNSYMTFYDTRGLELDSAAQKQSLKEIFGALDKNKKSKFCGQKIHCILYCINPNKQRVDDKEVDWIKEMLKITRVNGQPKIPLYVVLTQSFAVPPAEYMKNRIIEKIDGINGVIPILAEDYEIADDCVIKAYGVENLLNEIMQYTVSDDSDTVFKELRLNAEKSIAAAMTAAAATAATPIPFADAFLLVPIQITMITGITRVYGLNLSKSVISAIVSSALGTTGTTLIGKTIAGTFFKLLPGVGSAAGGVFNAATASLLTKALGEAYIRLMEMIVMGELSEDDLTGYKGKKKLSEMFKKNLKKQ